MGAIHDFLRGTGCDGRGRRLADVLAFDDARIEGVHDFIQWLFPLAEASRAVPGAPVLGAATCQKLIERVLALESVANIRELRPLLQKAG